MLDCGSAGRGANGLQHGFTLAAFVIHHFNFDQFVRFDGAGNFFLSGRHRLNPYPRSIPPVLDDGLVPVGSVFAWGSIFSWRHFNLDSLPPISILLENRL